MRLAAWLFLLVPLGFVPAAAFGQQVGDRIVVTAPRAALRSLEETTGAVRQGTVLAVKHVNGDWFWVSHDRREGVAKGWIHRADVVAWSQALGFLTAELACHPTAPLYDVRATIWSERGDADRAIADWSEAIRLDPKDVTTLVHRGEALGAKAAADMALAASIEKPEAPAAGDSRVAKVELPLLMQTGASTSSREGVKSADDWLPLDEDLKLSNTAFCRSISSYGNWEPLDRNEFKAGEGALVYCEVENFQSERTDKGVYRTTLKSRIEIFDGARRLVATMQFAAPDDLCKNHRRDYYNTYEFSIPQKCERGPHTLKLTVEDMSSHQSATSTVDFTVK